MTLHDNHAVIVGGGIGGLTAALLLARTGARVTLLERSPSPRAVGAGLLLAPNGLAVLDALGLAQRLREQGHQMYEGFVRDAAGRRSWTPEYSRLSSPTRSPQTSWRFHAADAGRALDTALASPAGGHHD